jgi:hypothetical protein
LDGDIRVLLGEKLCVNVDAGVGEELSYFVLSAETIQYPTSATSESLTYLLSF